MTRLDLDAKRAGRAEQLGDAPVLVVGGEEFQLPHKAPLIVLEELLAGRFVSGFSLLLGGQEKANKLLVLYGFDNEDLRDLLQEMYGVTLGEAKASTKS